MHTYTGIYLFQDMGIWTGIKESIKLILGQNLHCLLQFQKFTPGTRQILMVFLFLKQKPALKNMEKIPWKEPGKSPYISGF